MKLYYALVLMFLAACSLSPAVAEETFVGKPVVLDADTIQIDKTIIRLEGIDAIELEQWCKIKEEFYPCGVHAKEMLINFISDSTVTCVGEKYRIRVVGVCTLEYVEEGMEPQTVDLAEWITVQGYAVAFLKYTDKYAGAEEFAQKSGLGVWSTTWIHPRDFRKGKRLERS